MSPFEPSTQWDDPHSANNLFTRDTCACTNNASSGVDPSMNWTLDSRSLGIGIAIGLILAVIVAALAGLLTVSMRRTVPTSRNRKTQTRSRTTLPLSFSIPPKLTNSKNRQVPTTTERISIESRIVAAPGRSPSPEFILDIAPKKAREFSPSSPSTQLEPQSHFDTDLEEMRAANTFSGLPTSVNDASGSTSRRRLNSCPLDDSENSLDQKPRSPSQALNKRLSEQDSDLAKTSSSSSSLTAASAVVRRVQSEGFMSSTSMGTDLYPLPRPLKLELDWDQQPQEERPRGMGHTLPRPQTAKTISSRHGTGSVPQTGTSTGLTGLTSSLNFTPFSSSSSFAFPLINSTGGISPTANGSDPTSGPASHYPPQPQPQPQPLNAKEAELGVDSGNGPTRRPPKDHKRRRKRDKGSELSSGISRPSQALIQDSYTLNHNHESSVTHHQTQPRSLPHPRSPSIPHSTSHPHSQVNVFDQDQDIAPPPYNIANVHSSGPGPDYASRHRSDSRSGEMGFGQSHHARNHLL